ncbi:uncharacterized protein LOC129752983 [Uranotaenia lowii]|uniref:uncharacterized protein LOC129752983 n=1 Tax=Uranotaenia lowii TaxID=190385 RepID=UPI0024787D2B|nr:uncharacterized protein LOC129752983 [Uranotaenia lowii]
MGSALSPILADIVLNTLLETSINKLDFPVIILKKYVDDLFLILPEDKIQSTLEIFNSYDEHLQFTAEEETDGRLPFLDMTVIRNQNNTLDTEWYCKPISSGRMLNFLSFHSMHQKINVASNFIQRVTKLSSRMETRKQQQIITDHLKRNNYPPKLISRLFRRTTQNEKTYQNKQQKPEENPPAISPPPSPPPVAPPSPPPIPQPPIIEKPITYFSLPHIPGLSQQISKALQTQYPAIKIANRNTHTVNNFFTKMKDPISKSQIQNCIYSIPCETCPGRYVGKTTNSITQRMYGHKSNINTLEKLLRVGHEYTDQEVIQLGEKTALLKHCITFKHRFDLKNVNIVDRTHNPHTLDMLECFHIVTEPHAVNSRKDVQGVSVIYAGLLSNTKIQRGRKLHKTSMINNKPHSTIA